MTTNAPRARVSSGRIRRAVWGFTIVGVFALTLAWGWLGLAIAEEYTEQGKAEAAGTTMEGFALVAGGLPLLYAHAFGLVILAVLGWNVWRWRGIAFGVGAVACVSLIGLAIAQLLTGGDLFDPAQTFVP